MIGCSGQKKGPALMEFTFQVAVSASWAVERISATVCEHSTQSGLVIKTAWECRPSLSSSSSSSPRSFLQCSPSYNRQNKYVPTDQNAQEALRQGTCASNYKSESFETKRRTGWKKKKKRAFQAHHHQCYKHLKTVKSTMKLTRSRNLCSFHSDLHSWASHLLR